MKNIKILSALFIVGAMWSCDPLEDDIKEMEDGYSYVQDVEYTLTGDDYDAIDDVCDCTGFGNFGNEDDPKLYIPAIITEQFPGLGEGSAAKVTYELYIGSADGLGDYTYADSYFVSEEDYVGVSVETGDAAFFNNTTTSGDYIPSILDAGVESPSDGDLIAVSYNYAAVEYADISGEVIYMEDFEAYDADTENLEDLQQVISEVGDQGWYLYHSSSGYNAARISGNSGWPDYAGVPNVDWLILPEVDLTDYSDAVFKLNHTAPFMGAGQFETDIAVMVSTDYDGVDQSAATWVNLSLDQWPTGDDDDYDRVDSEASLSSYADQKIHIAFYYSSTVDYAAQWRVISATVDQGEVIATTRLNEFYEYSNSTWGLVDDNVYYLSSADYDAMGSPGKFDNFESSDPADNYVPTMLEGMYPFAQEEDAIFIIYKYYSSSAGETQTRGNLYTYTSGEWSGYSSNEDRILSFGHNGTVWEPDNTIKYSLTNDDFIAIGASTSETNPGGSASASNYKNFDLSLWSSDQILPAIAARLLDIPEIMQVDGQKYLVSYATWEPGSGSGSVHLIYSDADGAFIAVE